MTKPTSRTIWSAIAGMILLLIAGIGSLLVIGKLWPLPKGQGLAYVAHPFIALVGTAVLATAFLIVYLMKGRNWWTWFLIAFGGSIGFSLLVWGMR